MTHMNSKEFAQQPTNFKAAAPAANKTASTPTQHNKTDILLNSFQIKKKRFRVLLNCDHIVWERLDAKRNNDAAVAVAETQNTKEAEVETEQLSKRAAAATYGNASNVVHIDEIIRVAKGDTKAATFCNEPQPTTEFDDLAVIQPQIQQQHQPSAVPKPPTAQYLTIHYAQRLNKSPTDCNRWRVRTLTLYQRDPYIIQQWHTLLSKLLSSSKRQRVQRLLVFINPYGGRKQGLQTYEKFCKPLFELAGIDASCIISQRANQIRDILTSHDLTPFDAVCCVGGDGTVAEVINGLIFRRMRDLGLDLRQPTYIPKPQLPFAIIPAGSTDTVAYSLHGTADVRTAAIHLILGQRRGLDICSVRNRQGIMRFCASVMSYGYLGDVAAKSEKYRWMGTKRYEYAGVKAFFLNRGYEAEIRLMLQDNTNTVDNIPGELEALSNYGSITGASSAVSETARDSAGCYANCASCSDAIGTTDDQSMMHKATISFGTGNDCNDAGPTSSSTTLDTQKSSIENNSDANNASSNSSASVKGKPNNKDEDVDALRNINLEDCDKNAKATVLETEIQKASQIKELLKCDSAKRNAEELVNDAIIEPQNTFSVCSTNSSNNDSQQLRNVDESPVKWKVIKGEFFMISGANITCACTRSPLGISRYSHLGDGNVDLILVRKTSFWNNVRFLLNTVGRNGDIRNLPHVEVYRTRRFNFRTQLSTSAEEEYSSQGSCAPIVDVVPGDELYDNTFSRWNCDGEIVHDLDITMSSHCQLIDVFMRGPHAYTKPSSKEPNSKLCCCTTDN